MKSLRFKVALITGGTKGIGYAVAESLLKQGIYVAITGRTEEGAKDAAKQLNASGSDLAHAIGIVSDVRSFESQQEVVNAVIQEFGQLDIVIANAGVGHFASIEDLTVEKWQETIDTNLTGAFFSLKASVDELIKNKGYYISISSLAGTNFFAGGAAYNASKFGLTGFSQAVMLDLRKHGVKVSTIMPGSVSTYFNGNEPKESDAWKIQGEDIGEMVIDLLKMNPRTLPSKIEVRPTMPPTN
ncbi:MAG: 3-oxoacyl-[acyl-carrier protein] reductase [Flavobacteriaceae bacterium]|jgi:3-oxoacyl-[acyl-carrier protein] reductase